MISAEAIQKFADLARDGQAARVVDVPGDGRTAYVWAGGQMERITVDPPLRKHSINSLEDVIALATQWRGEGCPAIVWHGHAGDGGAVITVVRDQNQRDEWATLVLSYTDGFRCLAAMRQERRGLSQTGFIRMCRFDLGLVESQVTPFRQLGWSRAAEVKGTVRRGGESLGNEVKAVAAGIDQIPETIVVSLPVYRQKGVRSPVTIECAVELDVHEEAIYLMPAPQAMEIAEDVAHAYIHDCLYDALVPGEKDEQPGIPIYYGAP